MIKRKKYILELMLVVFLGLVIKVASAQNNWVYFSNTSNSCPSCVQVGNISISGTHLTIEAKIVKIPDGTVSCIPTYPGVGYDVVSKHDNPADVNYLLRPDHAEITTTNGLFKTNPAPISYNTCYHIAMVYDGSYLRFYLDGNVYDSVPVTGNVITNSWITNIGFHASLTAAHNTQFFGYVDEVRIWDVARTKCEIQTYMNQPLPNPTTQVGLLAYYNFDNGYTNIQGNSAFNGTTLGNPIRTTNPDACAFIVDTLTVSNDTTICPGQIVTISANGASTYSWSGGATTSSITVNPSSTTKYYVYATSCAGVEKDSVTVTVSANGPNLTVSNDTTICPGQIVTITANGASSYSWSGGATTSSITVNPSGTTTYYVYSSNSCGTTKDSVTVHISPPPILNVSNDTIICPGQNVILTASGSATYSWSTGSTNTSILVTPTSSTTYYVYGSTACGTIKDSVNVQVFPSGSSLTVSKDTSICPGQNVILTASGATNYLWTGGATTPSISVNPTSSSIYYVYTNTNCGTKYDSIIVSVYDLSPPQFIYTLSPCVAPVNFINQTSGFETYYWDFGDGGFSTNQNPTYIYPTSGTYVVTLFTNKGTVCADSIEQTINYSRDSILALHVPNVFTPNGDGKNDVFKISGLSDCKTYNLTIYNRWGMKVFETSNPESDFWNGHLTTPTGPSVPAGIYYYVLSGDESFAGFVTVIH